MNLRFEILTGLIVVLSAFGIVRSQYYENIDVDESYSNVLSLGAFNEEDVWKVNLGDVCQLTRFPLPAGEADKFLECLKPNRDSNDWPWNDKGLWVMKQCLGGTEFYPLTRSCKSKRFIRRQQNLCQSVVPTPTFCPQPTSQPIVIQPITPQAFCQCPINVPTCTCPQPTQPPPPPTIQPTTISQQITIQIFCAQQPQNSICQCPPTQPNCPPTVTPPQPCPLATGGSTNAKVGDICSWMLAPLAANPNDKKSYLQCHPAQGNFICGRWVRMPCAPATIFDVNAQVCVNDPNNIPAAVNPTPQIITTQQQCNCACQVGISIGQCNVQNQCPGQSSCQPTQPIVQNQQCQQQCQQVSYQCCYTGSVNGK